MAAPLVSFVCRAIFRLHTSTDIKRTLGSPVIPNDAILVSCLYSLPRYFLKVDLHKPRFLLTDVMRKRKRIAYLVRCVSRVNEPLKNCPNQTISVLHVVRQKRWLHSFQGRRQLRIFSKCIFQKYRKRSINLPTYLPR